jgi:dipeptidyl aminopeptidase/acylaminoacyl peptidase
MPWLRHSEIKNHNRSAFVSLIWQEGETMYHNFFRITWFCTAIAIILAGCGVSVPTSVPATESTIATESVPTAAEIAPTNTLEPAATQVVLGVVEGTIAFRSHRDSKADEIWVMNGDGSRLTRLTNNSSDDDLPAWSPDGTKIAFCSVRDGNWEIYVMNADGSHQTRLTDKPGEDCAPSWSPDGTQIIFMSNRDGNSEIYVMNADGGEQTRLTDNPAFDAFPDWVPDGRQIVFVSDSDGQADIYVMSADGGGITRLTSMGQMRFSFLIGRQMGEKSPSTLLVTATMKSTL